MMAFDRTPNTASLNPATIAELRAALSRSVEIGNHGDELKLLLSRAATEARGKGIQAEQLLMALKEIWYSLPHLAVQPGHDTQTRLLQQLIARCIQEYYAT
jgi:hypothetical protein